MDVHNVKIKPFESLSKSTYEDEQNILIHFMRGVRNFVVQFGGNCNLLFRQTIF